ncbi:hypothetical protein [Syntrophus aciditrophicus]|uniref:Hypothetical membrane protein n=1 Tax=Syntrophus aciditrophicus (strain SB) TaxID=56780 RepID=Q2LV09_SYNAS|nr:hypothetical protein [Syntrophus aciditrophicus]ABC77923.1 hypothetical membrane protein [Syntrophus aciditrophicus SB]
MIENLKDFFDEYSLKARVYPSLIALAPLFLFIYYVLKDDVGAGIVTNLISSTTITVVATYFLADVVRNLGKFLETKVFGNELYFPSTEILLNNNQHISQDRRSIIYENVKTDFDVSLSTAQEEIKDEVLARQKIKEAVGSIRQKVGNGRLLLQFNIRYGFWRNLVGISLFSSFLCLFNIVFILTSQNNNSVVLAVSIVLFVFYFLIFAFRKQILTFFGYQYANQLFLEYLNL